MNKWCPLSECVLSVVIAHLPSPIVAQTYRSDVVYKGGDQETIDAIKAGQENGKLFVHISKMLWTSDGGRRYAFGRILSGKLNKGERVRVITDQGVYHNKVTSNVQSRKRFLSNCNQCAVVAESG